MTSERTQAIALYICAAIVLLAPELVAVAVLVVVGAVLELVFSLWSSILLRRPRISRPFEVQFAALVLICAVVIRFVMVFQSVE